MKTRNLRSMVFSALAALLFAGCISEKHEQATLQGEAKISRADAEKSALARVPNGRIKEGELEKEKGKLIWSFDITTPDSKDVTEVGVDALTGEVLSVDRETPEQEAREKSEEAAKNGKDKD